MSAPALRMEDVAAEQALLGSALVDSFFCQEVVEKGCSDLFFDPLHARIFEAMGELHSRGEKVTPRSIKARLAGDPGLRELAAEPGLREAGGCYLTLLAKASPGVIDGPDGYLRKMREAKLRREAVGVIARGFDIEDEASTNIVAAPYRWIDPSQIPIRQFLDSGRHHARRYISAMIASGGAGKTTLEIAEAIAFASGSPVLGRNVPEQLRVWLWNLEDPIDEIWRRIAATCKHFSIGSADIADRLHVSSGRDQPCTIARTGHGGTYIVRPVVEQITAELLRARIDVLIVDPFVSCHAVSENDNGAVDMVAKEWARVAEAANCAIELTHHSRKQGDTELTSESARGASALVNACRSVRVLRRMTQEEAERAGVDNHRSFFRVVIDKANLVPPAEKSDWFRLENVDLGNGPPSDHVGVAMPWSWPDLFAGMTVADLREVQKRIAGGPYRQDVRSSTWAGIAVAEVVQKDLAAPGVRAQIGKQLEQWIRTGALKLVTRPDERRKAKVFIEVGSWV